MRKVLFVYMIVFSIVLFGLGSATLAMINNATDSPNNPKFIKEIKTVQEPFNILLLGGDASVARTDTMMLVNYDPVNAKIKILSIPRDTYVPNSGTSDKKMTSVFGLYGIINKNKIPEKSNIDMEKGAMGSSKEVSKLLGVTIKYYIAVDTLAFRKIIDVLGGVEVDIPINMKYDAPDTNLHINLTKGRKKLNGAEAEQYMRYRHPNGKYEFWSSEEKKYTDGSDLNRIDAQQKLIQELVKQKANVYYLSRMNSIIDIAFENIVTNLKTTNFLSATNVLSKFNSDSIHFYKLAGRTAFIKAPAYKEDLNVFIYENKIIDNTDQKNYPASEILSQYFGTKREQINSSVSDTKENGKESLD